jgi:hypothetical protein
LSERSGARLASETQGRPLAVAMAFLLIASFFSAAVALNTGASPASAQGTGSSLAEAVPDTSVFFMEIQLDQQSDQWVKTYELLDRAGLSDLLEQGADASPEQVAQIAELYSVTGKAAMVFSELNLDTQNAVSDITSEASSLTTDPLSVADNGIPEGFAVVFQPDDPAASTRTSRSWSPARPRTTARPSRRPSTTASRSSTGKPTTSSPTRPPSPRSRIWSCSRCARRTSSRSSTP